MMISYVILKESKCHHNIGSPMNGTHPSPKTDRNHLMKDNMGCYCLNTFKTSKGKEEKWCHLESNPGPLA